MRSRSRVARAAAATTIASSAAAKVPATASAAVTGATVHTTAGIGSVLPVAFGPNAARGGQVTDAGFWERLVWWCRTLTLTWLGEALEEHPCEVGRHIQWVERAFAEPDITMSHRE